MWCRDGDYYNWCGVEMGTIIIGVVWCRDGHYYNWCGVQCRYEPVRFFFISFIHRSWMTHFVRVFSIVKKIWLCSFLKLPFISIDFIRFLSERSFSKIICSVKPFFSIKSLVQKKTFVFSTSFLTKNFVHLKKRCPTLVVWCSVSLLYI